MLTGIISGSGNLTKEGANTLELTGVNTYTGATVVSDGILALSGGGSIENSSGVHLSETASAVFDISNGAGALIQGLSGGSASSYVDLGQQELVINNAGSNTFGGVITGTGGSLTKMGAGTLTLSGANIYTGDTTVNAGTLALTSNGSLTSDVYVASGAVFDLAGVANQNVALNSGGTMNWRNSGIINGDLDAAGAKRRTSPAARSTWASTAQVLLCKKATA